LATVVVEVNDVEGVGGEEALSPPENFFFICPKRVDATLAFLNPASCATRSQSTWKSRSTDVAGEEVVDVGKGGRRDKMG
jgi:hypothetical protein